MPANLSATRKVGFGICSGTSNPYGDTTPDHFVGVRTAASWNQFGVANAWSAGFILLTQDGAVETQHLTGAAVLRAPLSAENIWTAWYLRLTRLSATSLRIQTFFPNAADSPNENDFIKQMGRARWQSSVNNHNNYRETLSEITIDEAGNGALNTFNMFSNLNDFVTSRLGGIQWLSVRAVKLE